MFTKWMKRKEKIQEKGGEREMKRKLFLITTAALIIGIAISMCFAPLAQAEDDVSPWRTVYTFIKRVLDDSGKLIAQVGKNITHGFTNTDGERYKYDIVEDISFDVIGGVSIMVKQHIVESRTFTDVDGNPLKNDDGDLLTQTITTDLTYKIDLKTGIVQGISGTRTIEGYGDPIDANKDGTIDETEAKNRSYFKQTDTLEFAPIEDTSTFEIVKVTSHIDAYDKKDGTKISETDQVTINSYEVRNGAVKLIKSDTTGKTYDYSLGTTDGEDLAADKSNAAFTEFHTISYYDYDEAGNVLPTSEVTVDDLDGDLTEADVQELIDKATGSFTVTYSNGIKKGQEDQWVAFTTTELTIYEVNNGRLQWVAKGIGYSNDDYVPDAPANVATDPLITGKILGMRTVESAANNRGTKNIAIWVFIQGDDGKMYVVQFLNRPVTGISVGDKISVNADVLKGNVLRANSDPTKL